MSGIEAIHVGKIYKTPKIETKVINDISLSIEDGEFVTITGPSGSGKSTLLYLLSGMEPLSQGTIKFYGEDLQTMSDQRLSEIRRKDTAFVFQFYNLLAGMTVVDNLLLPSLIQKAPVDEKRVDEILELVKLKNYRGAYPYELSGGQQQRVAVARAMYANPKVIFADEPTGNLDSENSKAVMDIFQEINRKLKTTIVMVTHSEKFAEYGTRMIKIVDGKIND